MLKYCTRFWLNKKCRDRGKKNGECDECIVGIKEEDILLIDTTHPAYPGTTNISGVGTELKKLLSKIGINATPNCSCNSRAKLMDDNGIAWCENNIDTIVGWLKEEATKRKLPFVDIAGRILVKKAIKNAKNNQIK